MSKLTGSINTVPPFSVGVVLLLCAAAVVFMLPNNRKMVERQMQDGEPERALKIIRTLTAGERKRNESFFAQAELEARVMLLAQNATLAIETLTLGLRYQKEFPELNTWKPLINLTLPYIEDISAAYHAIQPVLVNMTEENHRTIIRALAARSLEKEQPNIAAQMEAELFRVTSHEGDLLETVRLWRLAGKSAEGLTILEGYVAKNPDAGRDVRLLQVDLLHEHGQPEQAFEILVELDQTEELTDESFELLVQLAQEAGRGPDLLPLLIKRLEKNPDDPSLLLGVAELAQAASDLRTAEEARLKLAALYPNNGEHYAIAAQMMEWQGFATRAFDHYLLALELGYLKCLEQVLALYPSLFKSRELSEAVAKLTLEEIPAELLPAVANLYLETGYYQKAATTYGRINDLFPDELQFKEERGWILIDLLSYETALTIFQELTAKKPANHDYLRGEAECLFRLGKPDEALPVYKKLAHTSTNLNMIENYIVLSTSLGLYGNVPEILEFKLEKFAAKTPYDFKRLAHAYNIIGKTNEMVSALSRGVEAFPGDLQLQLGAAYALGAKGDVVAASKLLGKNPGVRVEPDIAEAYLQMLVRSENFREADKFLRSGLTKQVLESDSLLEFKAENAERMYDLPEAVKSYRALWNKNPNDKQAAINYARLLVRTGKPVEAQKILEQIIDPKFPETYKLAAEVYNEAGKYKLAERYQAIYLETKPPELPLEFGFLGDIKLVRGDKTNAKRAYHKALDALLDQLGGPVPPKERASK